MTPFGTGIDVTRPFATGTPEWPGDTPFSFRWTSHHERGDHLAVGAFTASTHFGTHVDAPCHFLRGGGTVDTLAPELFFGPALVVDVRGQTELTVPADLARTSRILFRTDVWPVGAAFPAKIPTLAPETPDRLAAAGVRLVGFDLPSVDAVESHDLPIHHALHQHGIAILESLDLAGVPPAEYQLCALPLRLVGTDAAPVRAVLFPTG